MSFLTATSVVPPIILTLIALGCARLMVRNTASDNHEFISIDGLRGFLALFVFFHHAGFWLNYSHQRGWNGLDSALYRNFGETSICLFFMLSGFLFFHKLLESRRMELDWLRVFCSRLLRLTPLYIGVVAVIFLIIAIESRFTQYEDIAALKSNIMSWLLFTIPGHPDVNAHPATHLMTAGVIWTLAYEWYFYLCLPLIGLLVGAKSRPNSGIWLILSCICVLTFASWGLDSTLLFGFAGGAIAASVVRVPWLRELHQGKGANWVLLIGLVVAYTVFDNSSYFTRLTILTVCMSFIACGANLFGLLSCRSARALSAISYGIYLLHGLVLYMVMTHLINIQTRLSLTDQQHWFVVGACTPLIIGLAALSWRWIELPAIQSVPKLTNFLRTLHQSQPLNKPITTAPIETTGAKSDV